MTKFGPTMLSTPTNPASRRVGRGGFTLIEMMIVVVVLGILGLIAIPRISKQVNESKIRQAASVVAGDLEQAVSLAARSRRPLVIRCDCPNRTLLLRDRGAADSVRLRRSFNVGSGLEVTTMTLTPDSVVVFPNGILSDTLAVRLDGPDGYTRTVTLSRAGRVRVVAP
jgi:prepilin-type N-terminal cleavage/methylation domain-containing protein